MARALQSLPGASGVDQAHRGLSSFSGRCWMLQRSPRGSQRRRIHTQEFQDQHELIYIYVYLVCHLMSYVMLCYVMLCLYVCRYVCRYVCMCTLHAAPSLRAASSKESAVRCRPANQPNAFKTGSDLRAM